MAPKSSVKKTASTIPSSITVTTSRAAGSIARPKGLRKSQSSRAGLTMPVTRFLNKLKKMPEMPGRVSKSAGVYMSAVIEYLIAEILELSGNACRDNRLSRISPRHLMFSINTDEELNKLLKKVVIPGAGVLPKIYPALVPKIPAAGAIVAAKKKAPRAAAAAFLPAGMTLPDINLIKPGLVKTLSGSKKSKNITILSEKTLLNGQKLTVVQADITDVVVDAIVHPTNNAFYMGGEVGSAISRAGGPKLRNLVQDLHRTHGNLAICGAAISDGGDLPSQHVIHVYSPHWDTNQQVDRIDDLTQAVKNIFTVAETSKLKSIALPSISSGGNGFPKQVAAQTILRAINAYFKSLAAKSNLEQVYFVLYDPESVAIYTSELGKLEI